MLQMNLCMQMLAGNSEVSYMTNDALGIISTTHLIHADHNPLKARSPECLQLAALHYMAVDFAKTGAPAEMSLTLWPQEFPDFMERWERPMYVSNGVLGKRTPRGWAP
jgi:RNA-dependent RNA polymerase